MCNTVNEEKNTHIQSHILKNQMCQAVAAAKLFQSCPTLCDPIDSLPPGSPIPGILQSRILERVAISFSNAWNWKVKVKSLSRVWLLETPWSAAHQAPPSMGFCRQEYWRGVPLPSPDSRARPLISPVGLILLNQEARHKQKNSLSSPTDRLEIREWLLAKMRAIF